MIQKMVISSRIPVFLGLITIFIFNLNDCCLSPASNFGVSTLTASCIASLARVLGQCDIWVTMAHKAKMYAMLHSMMQK